MKILLALITIMMLFVISIETAYSNDADFIPPEVLRNMDPDIRSGKRPTFAAIKQGDIFGLRENPQFKEDFVIFDFDVAKLSTVQKRIVENWIRSGVNRLFLKDKDIETYSTLLSPVRSGRTIQTPNLLRHAVNTDCEILTFANLGRIYKEKWIWPFPCLHNVQEESSMIVEAGSGEAIAGSFSLGEGRVVFQVTVSSTDARRWQLNFWHWAMGLGVPGAADVSIAGSGAADSGLTLETVKKYDSIVLKNGDTVTGIVQNETFTVKASYGTVLFETDKIAKIVFEGSGRNVDVIRLKVGDKLSGIVQDENITVKLVSGTEVELAKDKVKEITIRRANAKE